MTRWIAAFALTQLVEVPIYACAYREKEPRVARRLAIAFAASAITHPFVWFVFPRVVHPYLVMLLFAEAFAVIAEAAWFRRLDMPRPLFWSFVANATSVGVGFALRALWPGLI